MKIKNKLTFIYTLIISIILVCLNLYIYIFSKTLTQNNFYIELKDRAAIAATLFLEADEQSSAIIKEYQNKYLKTLPVEIIRVYNDNDKPAFIDSSNVFIYEKSFIDNVRNKKEVRVEKNGRQVLGIYYQDNQGNFVIIASAIDKVGIAGLNQLKYILLFGFLVGIVIVFISGRYFTSLMIKPISDISYQADKISETNLHLRLNVHNKKDELGRLSITINKMLQRLESAFDLQKNFVSNASHELRTPLTSIIGNIEVTLAKARSVEEYKQVLFAILAETEKLQILTNGLLNLAQSNLGFSNLQKDDIRLDELLIELKDEVFSKRKADLVKIDFHEMPENTSRLTIRGDPNLLSIALLNIIDNACKFSNGNLVTTSLILEEKEIIIQIKDTGIGIDKNVLSLVTETFYRANNARSYTGSGIGLSLADKIIKLHGGKLSIVSVLNKGTEVSINFPLTS